jgi:hypothetical protein
MELRVFSIFLTSGKKGFFSKRHFEMAWILMVVLSCGNGLDYGIKDWQKRYFKERYGIHKIWIRFLAVENLLINLKCREFWKLYGEVLNQSKAWTIWKGQGPLCSPVVKKLPGAPTDLMSICRYKRFDGWIKTLWAPGLYGTMTV